MAYGLRIARQDRLSLVGVIGGAGAFLALIVVISAGLMCLGMLREMVADRHLAPLLRHVDGARTGAGLVVLGLSLVLAFVAERRLKPDSLAFGALAVLAAGAAALQALAPLDAFILTWPFVLIGLALTLGGPDRPWLRALLLLAALAQTLYWARLLFDLVGQTLPIALAPLAALAMAALSPVTPRAGPRTAMAGLGLGLAGVAIALLAMRP